MTLRALMLRAALGGAILAAGIAALVHACAVAHGQ
jgi:hypothetical protein